MPRHYDHRIEPGPFRDLRRAFVEWQKLMEDRSWYDEGDAPWWYNERAVMSLFVGAVWKSKGWAFEEYSTSKRFKTRRGRGTRAYGGRGDLAIWTRGDKQYAIEAKLSFPPAAMFGGVRIVTMCASEWSSPHLTSSAVSVGNGNRGFGSSSRSSLSNGPDGRWRGRFLGGVRKWS